MHKGNTRARRARPTEIISHFPRLIENFQFSAQEFYSKVEQALVAREVPDLLRQRVDWKEGGPLSARREYLRLTRERLVFDICAAPFGTGFFVSLWFGQKPLRFPLWLFVIILLVILIAYDWMVRSPYGLYHLLRREYQLPQAAVDKILLGGLALVILYLLLRIGTKLDQFLISTPILGFIYERYFRRITYYRVDLICMYRAAVEAAVNEVINDITKAQAIHPISELVERPLHPSLVSRRSV